MPNRCILMHTPIILHDCCRLKEVKKILYAYLYLVRLVESGVAQIICFKLSICFLEMSLICFFFSSRTKADLSSKCQSCFPYNENSW